jgi:hypothetical protein
MRESLRNIPVLIRGSDKIDRQIAAQAGEQPAQGALI